MKSLIVIGAGPAGIAAAEEAARLGAQVTLVAATKVGGRSTWSSLLPSKMALATATRHGGTSRLSNADFQALTTRVGTTQQAFSHMERERLLGAGVTIVDGSARFVDDHHVAVGDDTLAFDAAIVATGSGPVFTPALKPDGKIVIAPKLFPKRPGLPDSVVVIGAGVTGVEYCYAYAALGVRVTWVVDQLGVLPGFDRGLATSLVQEFDALGITRVEGARVSQMERREDGVTAVLTDGRQVQAALAFVAIGRKPDVADLDLEAAGLQVAENGPARGGLQVDEQGRTSVPHIFAAGDVTGAPFVVNKGLGQGWTAARAAMDQPAAIGSDWVLAAYSEPQVAQVGLTASAAQDAGVTVRVQRVDAARALKMHVMGHTAGWLELVSDPKDGRLLGAAAIGDHAADQLAPVALAMGAGLSVNALASTFSAYPTVSELAFMAARS